MSYCKQFGMLLIDKRVQHVSNLSLSLSALLFEILRNGNKTKVIDLIPKMYLNVPVCCETTVYYLDLIP